MNRETVEALRRTYDYFVENVVKAMMLRGVPEMSASEQQVAEYLGTQWAEANQAYLYHAEREARFYEHNTTQG